MAALWVAVLCVAGVPPILGLTEAPSPALCDLPPTLYLRGPNAKVLLGLSGPEGKLCRIRVLTQPRQLLYVQVVTEEMYGWTRAGLQGERVGPCPVKAFSLDDSFTAGWSSDPCALRVSTRSGLFPHQMDLEFVAPHAETQRTKHRKLIIAALKDGPCVHQDQTTCVAPPSRSLCPPREALTCQCPGGAWRPHADPSAPPLCEARVELLRLGLGALRWAAAGGGASSRGALLEAAREGNPWLKVTRFGTENNKAAENATPISVGAPRPRSFTFWGCTLAGMLAIGGVLLLCGLWEWCCPRRKPRPIARACSEATPSTAHCITELSGDASQAPPSYNDLEQPPAYASLFPEEKAGLSGDHDH